MWLDRLDAEHSNLRAAVQWYKENGEVEAGLRLAGALWRFWYIRGYYTEGRALLAGLLGNSEALSAHSGTGQGSIRDRSACRRPVRIAGASAFFEESLGDGGNCGTRRASVNSLNSLGVVAYHQQSDHKAALMFWDESLKVFQELGDRRMSRDRALSSNRGNALIERCDYQAGSCYSGRRSLRNLQGAGRQGENGLGPGHPWGGGLWRRRLYGQRVHMKRRPWSYSRNLGQTTLLWSLRGLGDVALAGGDSASSRHLLEDGLAMAQMLGDKQGTSWALSSLGDVALISRDYEAARPLVRRESGSVQRAE